MLKNDFDFCFTGSEEVFGQNLLSRLNILTFENNELIIKIPSLIYCGELTTSNGLDHVSVTYSVVCG